MLGSLFLFALLTTVRQPAPVVVDRLHTTGRERFPRARVGGIVAQPPSILARVKTGTGQRLKTTGYAPFPREHVGGVEPRARKGWANPSSGGLDGLLYGKRVVSKKIPPPRAVAVAWSFPTQYSGLRVYYAGTVHDLCLVAEVDAPSGMGGVLKIDKNGTEYAVYLVETGDGYASSVRIKTGTGIKAIRLKT